MTKITVELIVKKIEIQDSDIEIVTNEVLYGK